MFCLLRIINLLIIRKSAESQNLFWFDLKHDMILSFSSILLNSTKNCKVLFMFNFVWNYLHQISDNVSSSKSILAQILCVSFTLTLSLAPYLSKFNIWTFFFSRVNEEKKCGLVQQLVLHMFKALILKKRYSHPVNGDPP